MGLGRGVEEGGRRVLVVRRRGQCRLWGLVLVFFFSQIKEERNWGRLFFLVDGWWYVGKEKEICVFPPYIL